METNGRKCVENCSYVNMVKLCSIFSAVFPYDFYCPKLSMVWFKHVDTALSIILSVVHYSATTMHLFSHI